MTMTTAQAAREYAVALDDLAAARSWVAQCRGAKEGMRVNLCADWDTGMAVEGYKVVTREVARLVTRSVGSLLADAIHELEYEVARKRTQLTSVEDLASRDRAEVVEVPQ